MARRGTKRSEMPSGPWIRSARSICVFWLRVTASRWTSAGSCSMERRGGAARGPTCWSASTGSGRSGTPTRRSSTTRWRRWDDHLTETEWPALDKLTVHILEIHVSSSQSTFSRYIDKFHWQISGNSIVEKYASQTKLSWSIRSILLTMRLVFALSSCVD